MAAPNIVNVTTITAKTDLTDLTTGGDTITSNGAASGSVYKINSVVVSNIDGTNDAAVTINIVRGGITTVALASTITVPANSTLIAVSKDMGIYLEEDDLIQGIASVDGDLQAVCSYEIVTDGA